ncbi:MAG: ribonuclease P protein component [Parasphingorhabdus sp.]
MAAKHSLPKTDSSVNVEPSELLDSQSIEPATSQKPISVIRKRPDFVAANRGKRFVSPGFVLLIHKRRNGHAADHQAVRFGITVTKKIGNAVVRNRMKRRFRALISDILPKYGLDGADHILIGRKQDKGPAFGAMQADLEKGLKHLAKKF